MNSTVNYFYLKRGFKEGLKFKTSLPKYIEERLPKMDKPRIDEKELEAGCNNWMKERYNLQIRYLLKGQPIAVYKDEGILRQFYRQKAEKKYE